MPAVAQGRPPRVVIVGGGAGGATLARYLALNAEGRLAVTIVEPKRSYRTCFFSNLMLAGQHGGLALDHTYDRLSGQLGIAIRHATATAIERDKRLLRLSSGESLAYDRLVLSPGIAFDTRSIEGYGPQTADVMPHCWRGDQPIEVLAAKLSAMREGGVFALVAPAMPYRCPPGPYERVSMIAQVLKARNPRAKILIIDEKETFSKQALFLDGWKRHAGDMVEWLPLKAHGGVRGVKTADSTIVTAMQEFRADVACFVPKQTAGAIAQQAQLVDANGWCPILAESMQSTFDPAIHVIGDAARAQPMPKSAESAANQARIAGTAILRDLAQVDTGGERIANTCWSLLGPADGVKIGATYAAAGTEFKETSSYLSLVREHTTLRAATYQESLGWYRHVVENMFGGRPT